MILVIGATGNVGRHVLSQLHATGTADIRPPHHGKQAIAGYIAWSFTAESDPRVTFSTPIVDGDQAAIEFRVHARDNGRPITLAGCVFARFDADGLAVRTRDYWHTGDGHL
ncbi:nuclear transport factor 2 family protein [Nonomuraea candida]|uniref:nuclear transport factor 2 family protein n=1 Tax=Nonomuraea candida TaxID=359159 RepID=UPI000A0713CF|nr:nuclear transport factor 2 family protein [Nonomuraea candida]